MVGWLVFRPPYFSQHDVLSALLPALFAALCGVRAKNEKKTATQLATPVALDQRVHPASDPTSELVIYAVSGPGEQSSWAASGSKTTTGAVDLSAGAAMRENALFGAGACCCQCCCCCAAAAASTTTAPAFLRLDPFRAGMIIPELRSSYCIYPPCSLRPRQAA